MSTKTPAQIAEEALAALKAATDPIAKSMVEEATTAFNEACQIDTALVTQLKKAAPPEMDADGDYDGDTKKPKTQEGDEDCDDEAEKASELLDLSKTAHEVVKAYMIGATDDGDPEKSPWVGFTKAAKDYYSSLSQTLQQCVDARRSSVKALTESLAKSEDEKRKASGEFLSAAHEKLAKFAEVGIELSKAMDEAAVWPRVELRLDPPVSLDSISKGYMTIATAADVMAAVKEYKNVSLDDRPPAYTHIFNAAAALKTALPEGWHKPTTLPPERSKGTGSDQTVAVKDITEADKAAAMKKGVTIIGPSAGLLSAIRAIGASQLIERMTMQNKEDPNIAALKEWLGKGDAILVSIVGNDAEAIRMLDIPTFPASQAVIKFDHWADVAAKACIDSLTDAMPADQRSLRKQMAERLTEAAGEFKKAEVVTKSATEEGDKVAKADLDKVTEERDALSERLVKFTEALVPLTRSAQGQREQLKKMEAEIASLKAENEKLKAEPMPSKGRVGNAGALNKADGTETESGNLPSFSAALEKASKLPGAVGRDSLVDAAHALRADLMND